jgi:hypothetical protein
MVSARIWEHAITVSKNIRLSGELHQWWCHFGKFTSFLGWKRFVMEMLSLVVNTG